MTNRKAEEKDMPELLQLQKQVLEHEIENNNDSSLNELDKSLTELQNEYLVDGKTFLVVEDDDEIIASVRAYQQNNYCVIEYLLVHPDYQQNGIGSMLMGKAEKFFPGINQFKVSVLRKRKENILFYEKLGYNRNDNNIPDSEFVEMRKQITEDSVTMR